MRRKVYTVKVTNSDGSVDVYKTDGVNRPTKNGIPFNPLPNHKEINPMPLQSKITWSNPIKTPNQ